MIVIAFFSLIALMAIHELGHFIVAKKFGIKVEEFGIGYPPRVFSKKVGDTVYSLNLLPFGAFVRLPEENTVEEKDKFSKQPIWKRALVILAGVISFWLIAMILLSAVYTLGTRISVDDDAAKNLIDVRVQITGVSKRSPAEAAGLIAGDAIIKLEADGLSQETAKVIEVQEFIANHLGQPVIMTIGRADKQFTIEVVPRQAPPANEGAMGISLARTAFERYPWYLAIWQGITTTWLLTKGILIGYYQAIVNLLTHQPTGIEAVGPVGIASMVSQAGKLGLAYFLQIIAMISVYMAIFNALPIPIADGGKFFFLIIESWRKKPLNQEVEQKIDIAFFAVLLALMLFVTVKDIIKLF